MSKNLIKKPISGGAVVLKERGRDFFVEMSKKRWAKYRKEKKEWEKQEKMRKTKKV